jgi:N-acetyl-anhydromuramyl-L-alanine amidase AmpD
MSIENGIFDHEKVSQNIFAGIEHGSMSQVNSIVLHRTDSKTGLSTLNGYKSGRSVGAHFLIDESGSIFQTAHLNQRCWHVGILLSRCKEENTCTADELASVNKLLHQKGLSFSKRAKNLSRFEANKTYPQRFPSNDDSIGIEVVGRFSITNKNFTAPTNLQVEALKWLVDELTKHYSLNLRNDVFAHGKMARKEASEGVQLLNALLKDIK